MAYIIAKRYANFDLLPKCMKVIQSNYKNVSSQFYIINAEIVWNGKIGSEVNDAFAYACIFTQNFSLLIKMRGDSRALARNLRYFYQLEMLNIEKLLQNKFFIEFIHFLCNLPSDLRNDVYSQALEKTRTIC